MEHDPTGTSERIKILADGVRRMRFWFWIHHLARERTAELEKTQKLILM